MSECFIFSYAFHSTESALIRVFLFLKDGIEYAEKNGMFFIETSAKTADNINQLFEVRLHIYFLIATIFYL